MTGMSLVLSLRAVCRVPRATEHTCSGEAGAEPIQAEA